jgi:CRISPR-associated protein Csb1
MPQALAPLTLDALRDVVARSAAIRVCVRLQPAGGAGDKVFPATYAVDDKATTRYAKEERILDGKRVETVLLDSVQSQANRLEEALLAAAKEGLLDCPRVEVRFDDVEGLKDLGSISSLETPHRLADALLRDSLLGDKPFRLSEPGRAFTEARTNNANALLEYGPTALLLGVWDSTGPKGGSGCKFPRALVSEIIGVNVAYGVKTSSRLDPIAPSFQSPTEIYRAKSAEELWSTSKDSATLDDKGKPLTFKPSEINHGNIAPTIEPKIGGVTVEYAQQTVVLSLPALRKLRFSGASAEGTRAAHVALAALGLAGVVFQRERGYDLRSRCLLVPDEPLSFEVVPADGGERVRFALSTEDAAKLQRQSAQAVRDAGLPWRAEPLVLRPSEKLIELIRHTRRTSNP